MTALMVAVAGLGGPTPGPAPTPSPGPPMTDVLPIRPVVDIAVGPPPWVWAAIALALLAGFAFWWYRRRKSGGAEQVGPPPVQAHVAALAALRDLDASAGLTDREFYFSLTAIVKGFFEDRFDVPGREMTVEELLPLLERLPVPDRDHGTVRELLVRAEPVKFAGARAGENSRRRDLAAVEQAVRAIEDAARRQETEAAVPSPGGGAQPDSPVAVPVSSGAEETDGRSETAGGPSSA